MSNLYAVLGVNSDCSEKEITKAFRAKARVLHPDKQPPDASDADKLRACKAFQELVAAYEVLSDETKRKRHDLERSDKAAAPQTSASPQQTQGWRDRPEQQQRSPPQQHSQWQRRQQQYEDEDDEDDFWSRRQAKTQAEEEDDKDERRRKAQGERDKLYEGLGSHWVKPPPNMPKCTSNFPGFNPPARQRAKPVPKTKSKTANAKKKKRRKGRYSEEENSSDCDSDASSVLSFDIHINLKDYIFNLTEPAEFDDGVAQNEVWTIKPKQPATANPDVVEVDASDDAKRRAMTVPMAKAGAKPCCSVQ